MFSAPSSVYRSCSQIVATCPILMFVQFLTLWDQWEFTKSCGLSVSFFHYLSFFFFFFKLLWVMYLLRQHSRSSWTVWFLFYFIFSVKAVVVTNFWHLQCRSNLTVLSLVQRIINIEYFRWCNAVSNPKRTLERWTVYVSSGLCYNCFLLQCFGCSRTNTGLDSAPH